MRSVISVFIKCLCDSVLNIMPFTQRLCAAWLGGKACSRRMSPLERDPHLLCPSCRGQYCSRDVTCDTCRTWTDAQWIAFDARRAYKRRGGSTPVLGGGLAKVVAGAVEGDRALVPLPQQPPHALVPWGTFDVGTGAGAPSGSSFPTTTTTPSTSVASTPLFIMGAFLLPPFPLTVILLS